jgi:hypothetical protein
MVDNLELNAGSGGDMLAADEIAGIKHQRVKIQHGADGAASDVSAASPLPISAASLPLPAGAASAALQGAGLPAALGAGGGLKVDGSGSALPVVAQQSASLAYDGDTACTIKRVSGVAAGGAPGTDSMIAAVAGKKIRCLAMALFATAITANSVYVANDDNDLLANSDNPIPLAIDADGDAVAGFVLPWNPGGWWESDTVNEAISLHSSAAQDIVYMITYIEVA